MMFRLARLADRFSAVVMEGARGHDALRGEDRLHPVGVAVATVVLAVSVVAFATAMALALDHLVEGALTFTVGPAA